MPFGIILLILFFIRYNFEGLERVNPSSPKNCSIFWMERVKPFQPPQNCSIFGMERDKPFQPPKIVAFLGWKGLTLSSPKNCSV
jgi:hypothetical protein